MDEDRTQDKTGLGLGQNKTGRGTRYDKRMLLIDCMKEGVGARERAEGGVGSDNEMNELMVPIHSTSHIPR